MEKLINTIENLNSKHKVKSLLLEYAKELSKTQTPKTEKLFETLAIEILWMLTDYEVKKIKADTYEEIVKTLNAHKEDLATIETKIAEIHEEINPPQVG